MALAIGIRLGPYEISGFVGAGGMGEVYRAHDPRLRRDVAIKVLPHHLYSDSHRLHRFEQEARAAAGLNHPNILNVHDFGTHDGAPYIVTELLEGETLRTCLLVGRLPRRKSIEYAVQIARGLAAAHDKGIVHRDLKPENIFIVRDGTVKILDFGLAKLIERPLGSMDATCSLDSDDGRVVGTLGYMSPEQVRGKSADARSDIFSFGAILYEMLTGQSAFRGDSTFDTLSAILSKDPPELAHSDAEISPALNRIVRHCLEKFPDERFQSARDIAFDLNALSIDSGITSIASAVPERSTAMRRKTALALIAIALFAAGLLLGLDLVRKPPPPSYKQLTFRRGTVRSGRLAPGGQLVYAAAWEGNPTEIFVTNIDTQGSSTVGIHAEDVEAVSKSGELLLISDRHFVNAYVRPGTLSRASLTGAAPRPVMEDVQDADWSPDGTQIAVARFVHGQFQLEFPLGKVLYQTHGWITKLRVSPDGKSVAFLDHPIFGDDAGRVALVESSGNMRVLTPNYVSSQTLAWRNSSEIWFSASTSGSETNIYAVDLHGRISAVTQVPGGVQLLDVSSEGRAVVAQGHLRVSTMALGPGETKERNISIADWSLCMDLSKEGNFALIEEEAEGAQGGAYSVYLRKTDGSSPVRLGQGNAMRLSPDGRWALSSTLASPAQLQLLPTGAGEARLYPNNEVQPIGGACWLPDSKMFIYPGTNSNGEQRIYLQDVNGGALRPITPVGLSGNVRCSADGKKIAVSNPRQTWIVPLDGAPPTVVRGVQRNEFVISWALDGRSLLVTIPLQRPSKLIRFDIATGKRRVVKEFAPADVAGVEDVGPITVTPDLRYYTYSYSQHLNDIYAIEGLR